MALAQQVARAMNSSNLEPSEYQTVDVDRLTAIGLGPKHGSSLIRIRDAATNQKKSCDEAAKLDYAKNWNAALEVVWHKALWMAKRGRWKCRPDQVLKLARLALLQFIGGVCGGCSGRMFVNLERDGSANAVAKVCPYCNGAGQSRAGLEVETLALVLGASPSEVKRNWFERLMTLTGSVEGLRRAALSETGRRLGDE